MVRSKRSIEPAVRLMPYEPAVPHRSNIMDRTWEVAVQTGALEEDSGFRGLLQGIARTGLQWGGLLGILGVTVLATAYSLLLGRPTTLWYPAEYAPEIYVIWDEIAVFLLCAVAVWIGRTCRQLIITRSAGFVITVAAVSVAFIHDAFRGLLNLEYFTVIYLLSVAAIPYRPWQTLLLGGTLGTVFFTIAQYGIPGTQAAGAALVETRHLVHIGFVTVVLTGVSALLYSVRYRQYQARQEAEALREEVTSLERAKSRFFADISHEFRTPLTLILAPLPDMLKERFGAVPSEMQHHLQTMNEQGHRLKRLVNQLLELSKLDEGHMDLSVRRCDAAALLDRVVLPFRDWAEKEDIDFRVEVAFDELDLRVDPERFEQIMANLLSNAIKYTPQQGAIRVRAQRAAGALEIAVRDTGPGLPADVEARVFDRHQSHLPVTEEADRTETPDSWISMGIGLALVKALVERHQGTIEVDSEPNFGTEFTVRLPLGTDHISDDDWASSGEQRTTGPMDRTDGLAAASPAEPAASDAGDGSKPDDDAPAILIVEDDPAMRTYLEQLLGADYRVRTAADTEAALERLREAAPALVISDIAMPGRDGLDLCQVIRDDEQLRHLPVILLTAHAEDENQLRGLEAGADAYVSKPFDPAELQARVENLIEIRQIVQERVRVPDWMQPREKTVSSEDADFLEELQEVVEQEVANSNFGVDWLAHEVDLSTRHLQRRIKKLTGLSAAGFIRAIRLQHAAALLRNGADPTIAEVASSVGYRDASYFSRLFRETFGVPPSTYAEQEHEAEDSPFDALN